MCFLYSCQNLIFFALFIHCIEFLTTKKQSYFKVTLFIRNTIKFLKNRSEGAITNFITILVEFLMTMFSQLVDIFSGVFHILHYIFYLEQWACYYYLLLFLFLLIFLLSVTLLCVCTVFFLPK